MPIQVLASHVADAIAAGEVVERPASVVKELVENALDAGARRVTVEVRGAGRTLLRVVDDGAGIPPEELALAFRRHATSKVVTLDDLGAIDTLGFRGEALASIAAVADVECRSRGARIRLRGGEVLEEGVAQPVPGTVLEVRDLFSQTPARLAFLKSDATESAACVKTVQSYALLYPEVRFELRMDDRTSLRTPGSGDAVATVAAVLGPRVAAEMRAVRGEGVSGLTSEPRLSRGTREAMLLAVNRRPIASRSLTYAIEESYLGSLEKGRYPVTVLDLRIEPDQLDVNVHPAKREVRFQAEREVFGAVQRALRSALAETRPYEITSENLRGSTVPIAQAAIADLRQVTDHRPPIDLGSAPAEPPPPAGNPGPLRPLGQVREAYLVAESEDGVVLIDQHAAHERVLYNHFLAQIASSGAVSQPLLLAETIEAEPSLIAAASDNEAQLRQLGFEVEPFGPGLLRIHAGPAEIAPDRLREAVLELLGILAERRPDDTRERVAASLACHSAVRFGDRMDPAEQRRLLADLERATDAITCPHGRPTRLLLTWQELTRHFRRNY
ncbi:MAG TPA: DNA mismatch repair endonuclease MutL [Candidatus Dormibacteraeota bacterium]|jgi:DNA mismatch repair protein MutL|nr:DNA mismatch repair endonuclease MutL [Candidatus Dormibacteraeota bacterium]